MFLRRLGEQYGEALFMASQKTANLMDIPKPAAMKKPVAPKPLTPIKPKLPTGQITVDQSPGFKNVGNAVDFEKPKIKNIAIPSPTYDAEGNVSMSGYPGKM